MFEQLKTRLSVVALDTLTTRFFLLFLFLLAIPLITVIIFTSSLLANHLEETDDAQLALSQRLFQSRLQTLEEKLGVIQQAIPGVLDISRAVYPQLCPSGGAEILCFYLDKKTKTVHRVENAAEPLASLSPSSATLMQIPKHTTFLMPWDNGALYLVKKSALLGQYDVFTGYPINQRFLNRLYREQPSLRTRIWILKEPFRPRTRHHGDTGVAEEPASLTPWFTGATMQDNKLEKALLSHLAAPGGTKGTFSLPNDKDAQFKIAQSTLYSGNDEPVARVIHVLPLTANQVLQSYYAGIYIIAVASLVFTVLLAMLAGRTITQPLLKLIQQVNTLSRENVMKGEVAIKGVHEIQQLGEAFNRMISRLRQEYKMKDEFVATLTHDLKVPLIAEKQTLTYFKNKTYGDTSGEQDEVLEVLQQSNKSCLALVNGILEVYRYDAGEVSLFMEAFNLPKLLRETIGELSPLAREKSITLETHSPFDENSQNGLVHADRMEIKRVLHNLVSNAITNTPPHGKIRCTVTDAGNHGGNILYKVSGFRHTTLKYPVKLDDRLLICVQDTGAGFPTEDLPHLFKQFAGSRGRNPMSIGLGLYNCYQVVKAHNGVLWVESTEGEGSVVSFVLAQSEQTAQDRRRFGDRRKSQR